MKAATAIRTFINKNTDEQSKVSMQELREFRDACTKEEWASFGMQACKLLGEIFEPT